MKLNVNNLQVAIFTQKADEYISLTDMARYKDNERTNYIIQNWMRMRSTIEFLGLWEQLTTPILKASKSMPLKMKQDQTASP